MIQGLNGNILSKPNDSKPEISQAQLKPNFKLELSRGVGKTQKQGEERERERERNLL